MRQARLAELAAVAAAVALAPGGCNGTSVAPLPDADSGTDAADDQAVASDAPGDRSVAADAGVDQSTAPDATADAAVTPSSCPVGSNSALFVSEQAPPATLAPGQAVLATVTFVNCTNGTWNAAAVNAPTGYKLGALDPQDNDTWGPSRIALPADVPNTFQVTVSIPVTAPPLTGSFGYAWGIVNEGVAWIAQPSPSHTITVQATPVLATICAGVQADIGGGASASAQIQQCIAATPSGGTLELPAGTYRITSELDIDKPMTLRTSGTSGNLVGCLDASPPPCSVPTTT